jgi:cytochrome P450
MGRSTSSTRRPAFDVSEGAAILSQTETPPPYLAGKIRITSFAEVNEILRDPDFAAGRTEDESLPFRDRTLLELDGEEHRQRRKLETPLFSTLRLDQYEHEILEPAIARVLERAAAFRGTDGLVRVDLARLSQSLFLEVAAALIGLDDVETLERTELLEDCVSRLNIAFDVKYATRDHTEVIAEGLAAKQLLIERFFEPSARRREEMLASEAAGELTAEDVPNDLLTTLLRHRSDGWDDDLPVRETILFLAGATSTTSNAVNHAVVELDSWLAEHPGDREQLGNPVFLRGVCNEALRLHQNVTALVRRATRDITLSTGRLICANEFVALDFVEANQDLDAFGSDAKSFNPWRKVAPAIRPYGLTFGAGRHTCIGLPLVTPPSGRPPRQEESERAMTMILRALLGAGIRLDPDRPPKYLATAEGVYESLPVILAAR